MAYEQTLFNVDPYYDDYDQDKKHLRLMFRPGYGVQARELTQIQTVLQNQIERFGSHIFDEGSIVLDGQITSNRLKYSRLILGPGLSHTDFIGNTLYNTTQVGPNLAYGRIVHAEPGIQTDPSPVIFFEYLSGGTGFTNADVVAGTASNQQQLTATITGSVGDALVVSVDRGVRFVEGFFVLNDAQSLGAYSLTNGIRVYENPITSVGFEVSKVFVNAEQDETLTDPAFGYYNYAAPGADRYKIDMILSQRGYTASDTSTTDNFSRVGFVEFMRVVGGEIVKVEKYPDYAMLEDTLARRTYDESGNYTVVPFELDTRGISGDSTKLKLELSPGKAYIFGYEFETQGVTKFDLNKARTTRSLTRNFSTNVGPYTKVVFSGVTGSVGSVSDFGLNPILILVTGSSGQGGSGKKIAGEIGRARMRRVERFTDSIYNLSLYDINLTAGAQFDDVERVFIAGVTHSDRHLFTLTGNAGLQGTDQSLLIWEIPDGYVAKSIDNADIAFTYHHTENSIPSFPYRFTVPIPTGRLSTTSSVWSIISQVSLPDADVIVFDQNGVILSGTADTNGAGNVLDVTVNGDISTSQKLYCMASIDFDAEPAVKSKQLMVTSQSLTGTFYSLTGDGKGTTSNTLYFNGLVDVESVISLTGYKDSGLTNIMPFFSFDDGQRDDMYDWSRMTLIPGVEGITGPYSATFRYYKRNAGDGFFTVQSYTGSDVSSDFVPTYKSRSTGRIIKLRDCIDFRPDRGTTTSNVSFDYSLASSAQSPYLSAWIPTNSAANDNEFEYTHYLPRTDKLILTRDRVFELINGVASINPEPPPDDPNGMTLYTIGLNPYTFGPDDVNIRLVENKRYTMRDIGDLEKRIEAIEYYTTLNLLEQDAKSISIKDESDNEMPKRGIIVDQFKGHVVGDNSDPMFAASVDYEKNELRPPFASKSFSLTGGLFESMTGNSRDNVYTLNYTTSPEINNISSTTSIRVNPFGVVSFLGTMTISPSSDIWYDDTKKPKVRVNIEGENDNWQNNKNYGFGTRYNDWESTWFGKSLSEEKSSRPNTQTSSSLNARVSGIALNSLNSSTTPESIKKKVQEKSIVKDVLPIARERKIDIKAKGLKPNTEFYVYCDDIIVNQFCSGQSKTDGNGEITNLVFNFNLTNPSYEKQNFTTGRHVIRIVGSDLVVEDENVLIDNPDTWCMSADAVYVVEGAYDTVSESKTLSTRIPLTKRKSAKSKKVVSNLSEVLTSSGEISGWQEPLCQTFYVDPNKYPSGVFMKYVDLYFESKESLTSIPVTVEIRQTMSGYPHPSKVMPFGTSTLYSNSINTGTRISSGDSGYTRFEFSSPIFLLPGEEYAACVITNSANYSVFTSLIGAFTLKDNESDPNFIATKQPAFRSLFKTQNAGKLTKTENESLCMRVGLCIFDTVSVSKVVFSKENVFGDNEDVHNLVRINSTVALPEGCSYSCSLYPVGEIVSNKNVVPSTGYFDLDPPAGGWGTVSNYFFLAFQSKNKYVSPIFDKERSSSVLVKNDVNNSSNTDRESVAYNGELDISNQAISESYRTKARYITKQITLEPGIEAENITVKMSLCNPTKQYSGNSLLSSSIDVFARVMPVGGGDFGNTEYIKLASFDSGFSYSEDDFREVSFTNIGHGIVLPKFSTFSIKLVMYGDPNGAVFPKVRNLRVVAT